MTNASHNAVGPADDGAETMTDTNSDAFSIRSIGTEGGAPARIALFANAIALEVDRAALYGSAVDPEPKGIKNQTGVTLTAFGGANGARPTNYDWALDGIQM